MPYRLRSIALACAIGAALALTLFYGL